MDEAPEAIHLKKKSRRFGMLGALLFFLSALFSGVHFSFLLILGLGGIYCTFLWIYFSYRATPKEKSFEYRSADGFSWESASQGKSATSNRFGFLVIAGGMVFIFLMAIFIFAGNPSVEEPLTEDLQVTESSQPEAEDYSVILKREPDNIDALTNAGNAFYESEHYDSALYYYDRVLRLDAGNSAVLYNKALVRYNQKDFSGATELLLRCVQIDPSNTDVRMVLGDCYENQNHRDLALIQYTKAYELGTRTPGLSNMLAYIYDEKGDAGKAISFYKETLEQDSSRADVYTRLAVLEPGRKVWYEKKASEWKAK